ncbi:MAG: hypothetical protein MI757_01920, partial [Pirellulales bacterium]|nr:hypothetical protein [Pirellulales bacterium]
PNDTTVVPSDTASLANEIDLIKADSDATRVVLTDLVHVGEVTEVAVNASGRNRAAVRFEVEYRPSESEWASYKAGSITRSALEWPQSVSGNNAGMRQVWLRTEIQLDTQVGQTDEVFTAPYFGSAAVYYRLEK